MHNGYYLYIILYFLLYFNNISLFLCRAFIHSFLSIHLLSSQNSYVRARGVFRFPLRTQEQARVSELVSSHQPFTSDDVLHIFDKFIEMGSQILLNLKFLREVTLHVWNPGCAAPEEVYRVGLDKSRMKEDEIEKRSSLFLLLASKLEACRRSSAGDAAKESLFEAMLDQTPAKDFPQEIYNVHCIVKGRRRRRRTIASVEGEGIYGVPPSSSCAGRLTLGLGGPHRVSAAAVSAISS
jgi:hypothetical protein